jgi:hypothetical protein
MSDPEGEVDWSLATWEGSRREQLRRAQLMTVRERLQAMEDLAEVSRRLSEMRVGRTSSVRGRSAGQT